LEFFVYEGTQLVGEAMLVVFEYVDQDYSVARKQQVEISELGGLVVVHLMHVEVVITIDL
jgi:hypothetical protein